MKMNQVTLTFLSLLSVCVVSALVAPRSFHRVTELQAANRRDFVRGVALVAGGLLLPLTANANIYLDPAMYGDQELRVAAVDSLRERVRQAILQKPALAPSFYQLSLLDGLSYDQNTKEGGPNGAIVTAVLSSKDSDDYMNDLKEACNVLIKAGIDLKKYTAITIGDAVAIGGGEAIHAIGGPTLPVQLGRMEPDKKIIPNVNVRLFDGTASPKEINQAFLKAGMTEREMTALLGALLTLERVEKTRSNDDWKASARPKFREAGKMGRMSEFKRLTDEDIEAMEDENAEEEVYIADSFGTRDQAFGATIGSDQISEKTFNKFLQDLNSLAGKKGSSLTSFGWIATVLLDKNIPQSQQWLSKYASSNLSYLKDLGVAFNAISQLGATYTGGKYESLLKNKPRKSLNNDDIKLF
jgi:hypothetical protein